MTHDRFRPTEALWLTLPGAAMCSLPVGIYAMPRLLQPLGMAVSPALASTGWLATFVLVPLTCATSRLAYRHCISTTGHPGLRIVLILFNHFARGLADLACALFGFGSFALVGSTIWRAWNYRP